MILDCAGLEEDEEVTESLDSVGPGEVGSVFWFSLSLSSSTEVAMGRDERRWRWGSTLDFTGALPLLTRLRVIWTAVLDEDVRVTVGRGVLLIGVPGTLPSLRGRGESFLIDNADGARTDLSPDPVRRIGSAENMPSGLG